LLLFAGYSFFLRRKMRLHAFGGQKQAQHFKRQNNIFIIMVQEKECN